MSPSGVIFSSSPLRLVGYVCTAVILSWVSLLILCNFIPRVADGSRIEDRSVSSHHQDRSRRVTRDSASDVCVRWSQQSAIVNGTLYLYGGQASSEPAQSSNTWNNNLLSISLTDSFQIASPTLENLPQPSGPPAVANGYLWNSPSSLHLYGGLFSDSPATSPAPFSLWEYDIPSSRWKEHGNPQSSAGNNSEPDDVPIQRAAEGAGLSVPQLGRGWYFGGHLDGYTTPGWSQSIARVYLKSLVEYTFPGYTNDGVRGLNGGKKASIDGAWRNITEGGAQVSAGFPERADGVLVYISGWGDDGIIVGLAGGTNQSFSQMNVVDVYDIGNSTWYKQATSGTTPEIRVNPCAVAAAAPDGSSFQILLYGGQNLIPYGDQQQYDDIWVLSLPSFTWIQIDTDGQSVPPARAGHTCNAWNAQMIVVGGYVGKNLSCDSPGIYVFNMSSLEWQNQYNALPGGNELNQQPAQEDAAKNQGYVGVSGSYGYTVPKAVQSVIGGNSTGGATLTKPVQTPTGGPVATGAPPTFTVPGTTQTAVVGGGGGGISHDNGTTGPNTPAIIAGVLAGVLGIAAIYLGFCAWLYRKQLSMYKRHLALTQGVGGSEGPEKLLTVPGANGPESSHSSGIGQAATGYSGGGYNSLNGQNSGAVSAEDDDDEDLLQGHEPTFVGVLMSPRRTLRVVNRD